MSLATFGSPLTTHTTGKTAPSAAPVIHRETVKLTYLTRTRTKRRNDKRNENENKQTDRQDKRRKMVKEGKHTTERKRKKDGQS